MNLVPKSPNLINLCISTLASRALHLYLWGGVLPFFSAGPFPPILWSDGSEIGPCFEYRVRRTADRAELV